MPTKVTEQEQADAMEQLRELFPEKSTVTTLVRHVTSSGMGRSISVLAVQNGDIEDVSYLVRRVVGRELDRTHGGVKVKGAGMDMTFALVYDLALRLYGNGYALNKRNI